MKLDFIFVFDSNHVTWNINDLFVDGYVFSVDQHSGVVEASCIFISANQGLKSSFQELLYGHSQNVIELIFFFAVQQTKLKHFPEKSVSFENSSFVFLFKSEEFSGSLS